MSILNSITRCNFPSGILLCLNVISILSKMVEYQRRVYSHVRIRYRIEYICTPEVLVRFLDRQFA